MTMLMKPPTNKRSARRVKSPAAAHTHAKTTRRVTGSAKGKTLAEINHWMEQNADLVMKVARQNTLRLTGKEVL